MLVLNFSHPITDHQRSQIEALAKKPIERIIDIPAQFENALPFASQVEELVNSIKLSPLQWQTLPFLISPPSYNFAAAALLAELEGRIGYLPTIVRTRPIMDVTPTAFEVAELLNLAEIRAQAREARST